jgi:hypothetical protein
MYELQMHKTSIYMWLVHSMSEGGEVYREEVEAMQTEIK